MLSEKDLEAVFSVIPEIDARKARAQLSQRLTFQIGPVDGEIGWVDFSPDFRVERAGVTDFGGLSSRLIFAPSQHPLLSGLITAAQDDDLKAGSMVMDSREDRLLWYVPLGGELGAVFGGSAIRGLSVGPDVFSRFVDGFNPDAKLTPAEHRVVFHVVGGLSLHESAERDGLAVETRRGQLKRLCSKLGISGQSALIRLVLSQAIHLLFLVDYESKYTRAAESFASAHLPADVRLEIRRVPSGRLMRIFEAGPVDGTPIVVFHALLFPILLQSLSTLLDAAGLRIVMPLRPGYLVGDTDPKIGADLDADDIALEDFASYITESFGGPVVIAGHSMGCNAATQFAAEFPNQCKHLTLLSPYFGREPKGSKGYIARILKTLSRFPHNATVFRLVAQQFARSYRKRSTVLSALNSTFGSSVSDKGVVEGEAGIAPVDSWFGEAFASSSNGVAEDFRAIVKSDKTTPSGLKPPVSVLYGDDDPLTPRDVLDQMMRSLPEAEITLLDGAGHLAVGAQAEQVVAHLRRVAG